MRGSGRAHEPCVRPRFRGALFAAGCPSAFAVVGESSPARPPAGCFRFNDALAIDGVVGPPGVGAEAGVDADATGVEPDACDAWGVPWPALPSAPSEAFWDCAPLEGPCEGPATALAALFVNMVGAPLIPLIPCPPKEDELST